MRRTLVLAGLLCLPTGLRTQTFLSIPDTRQIARIDIPQRLVGQALQLMGSAFPNEAGMCFYGRVDWQGNGTAVLSVLEVVEAQSDSTSPSSRRWDPDGPMHGCLDRDGSTLIGVGHSHPLTSCTIGSISVPDMRALLSDSRIYFSSVWCFDGKLLLVWQGGWRDIVPYAHIQTPPS